jgi:hypothetical protein
MKSFDQWLLEKDPEFHEGIQVGRVGKWLAKKGLPLALNTYFAVSDPINFATHYNPLRAMNQGSRLTYADDWFAQQQSDTKKHRLQKGKACRRRIKGRDSLPTGDV